MLLLRWRSVLILLAARLAFLRTRPLLALVVLTIPVRIKLPNIA